MLRSETWAILGGRFFEQAGSGGRLGSKKRPIIISSDDEEEEEDDDGRQEKELERMVMMMMSLTNPRANGWKKIQSCAADATGES